MYRLLLTSVVVLLPAYAQAQEAQDKSRYHLFHPTPREQMRPLSADRPDITESPYTVDAGHFQIEMSFFDYTHDDERGRRTETWAFADTNLKVGLTNQMDIQFVFTAFGQEASHGPGRDEVDRGLGDLTIRWKTNLWGNDSGAVALGVMPFITIPTGTDLSVNELEGGLIVPLGIAVSEGISIGLMGEVDVVYDEEDEGYDLQFVHTATCGFDIVDPLGGFVEYVGILSSDADADYEAYFNTGLVYAVTDDLVFDTGVRIGLNRAAQDIGVFAGMTLRY